MTALQQRRIDAKAIEASRHSTYHNGIETKVLGIRMSVASWDVLHEAFDRSTGEHADHGFGHWVLHYAIEGSLRERSSK